MKEILDELRKALTTEAEAIQALVGRMDEAAVSAVRIMLECAGKVVVTGMGKSGHIANKFAATLASTGTPAFFLHPAEAIHGDLGMVGPGDVVIAISNSGSTEEILRLLGPLRRIDVKLIAMTGNPGSELAKRAEVHLDVSVAKEACPLNLAPTASTTAALAMGDALAVALLSLRNFKAEDYAVFHPGGNLGKKLMTTVGDIMDQGKELPRVSADTSVKEAVEEIQAKNYGLTAVTDEGGILVGAFSLGDLMRLHTKDPSLGFMEESVSLHMNTNPRSMEPGTLAARALHTMETHNIRAVFVIDSMGRPVGIIGIYEVLKSIDY